VTSDCAEGERLFRAAHCEHVTSDCAEGERLFRAAHLHNIVPSVVGMFSNVV
jgi:hypothetical protein